MREDKKVKAGRPMRWRDYIRKATAAKKYLPSIGSAAAGALLGTAAQNFANSNLRMTSAIAVVLGLFLILIHAKLTVRDREIAESNKLLLDDLATANQTLREQTAQDASSVISKILDLEKQVGVEIQYQLVAEVERTASWRSDLVGGNVEKAKKEIFILDLLSATGQRPDTYQDDRLESFYSILIKKAANGVVYRRVLQVDDPSKRVPCLPDTSFRRHCQEVCLIRKEKRAWSASIRVARRRYPYRFIIIDERIVVIQLAHGESNVVDEQVDYCWLVISDPVGNLVKVFLNMWDDVVEAQDTRLLALEELDLDVGESR